MRKILFLCTANSARSILAEAILNACGGSRFKAYSAGSRPRGEPNPLALRLLVGRGHPTDGLRSKNWNVFTGSDAEMIDCVITVCDNAAGESCPVWPGHPVQVHWGIPDPAGHSDDGEMAAFEIAYARLVRRIDAMLALDEDSLNPIEWRDALFLIGRESEGSTTGG